MEVPVRSRETILIARLSIYAFRWRMCAQCCTCMRIPFHLRVKCLYASTLIAWQVVARRCKAIKRRTMIEPWLSSSGISADLTNDDPLDKWISLKNIRSIHFHARKLIYFLSLRDYFVVTQHCRKTRVRKTVVCWFW